jgi:hypothetical protein
MATMREKAAKVLWLKDISLTDEITVKEIVDLLEHFGFEIAREYYYKGVGDSMIGKVVQELTFEKTDPS